MTLDEILIYLANPNNWRSLRMWPLDIVLTVWVGEKNPCTLAKEALKQLHSNVRIVSITHNQEGEGVANGSSS